jgi:hypothetical protein
MKLHRFDLQGKQHGYVDNYKAGLDDRFEIVRRPYSDLHGHQRFPQRHFDDDYDRRGLSDRRGFNDRRDFDNLV